MNHVDLTVTPPPYREALASFPVAVNGGCVDISKRVVSDAVLRAGEDWDGPVIVKTNANCGGRMEERLLGRRLLARLGDSIQRQVSSYLGPVEADRARWSTTRSIPTDDYPVFPSLDDVPSGILGNPSLVVERFVPEREGDLFALRTYTLLGDRAISRRVVAVGPIVKAGGVVRREPVEPHPDATAAAARFGLDYGKVDYVVHDGRATILDVNRTPTFGPRLDEEGRRRTAETLAPGLADLWARSGRV